MKRTCHRCLALMVSFCFVLQVLPFSVWAQADPSDAQPPDTFQEDIFEKGSSALDVEWEGTGALNADGTPVTAEQGDASAASDSSIDTAPPAQPASYTLTLNLDGGQANNLQNAGWRQSVSDTYQWTRSVAEEQAGQGILLTLDSTLGGLLPNQPYRAGYSFTAWKIDETEYRAADGQTITITADTTILAQWQIAAYTVSFQGSTGELWSVEVPYGATLWTDPSTPWTADTVDWTDDTATLPITLNGITHEAVCVSRHPLAATDSPPYYYTFTLDRIPYFTYGGPIPAKDGQHFAGWKPMSSGNGFIVTGNAVFAAQFQAEEPYVFNIYFYYENGTKARDTLAVTKTQSDMQNGFLTFAVRIPSIPYYTASPTSQDGVTWHDSKVTVDVDTVFGVDDTSTTHFLTLTVIYKPAQITYTVEYYQQSVNAEEGYIQVGATSVQSIEYGSRISIKDAPSLGDDVSFAGFQISASSRSAISEGVVLQEGAPNVRFDPNGNAIVRVDYDRASYFVYFQTGTTEVQIDPVKILFGAQMPSLEGYIKQLTRTGYQPVTTENITWYRLNGNGDLVQVVSPYGETSPQMPAHDLYAVVTWRPATTSIRLLYWVESRNAASFQNAYATTVSNVATESVLEVRLEGSTVTISGEGWPRETNGETVVSDGFKSLVASHYGTDGDYSAFFSYSETNTRISVGNVSNARFTGSGGVIDDAITEDSFNVKVNGNGTTTINIYYTRNLYTLEFVLARQDQHDQTFSVAADTPGSFSNCEWSASETAVDQFVFEDFSGDVTSTVVSHETYGELDVQKIYRITEAMDQDPRSAVGRYGTKQITDSEGDDAGTYTCFVYTLTARFEADISALWPTLSNTSGTYSHYNYISMGTDQNSYYRNVFTQGNSQKNTLNAYSTMDMNIVAAVDEEENWTAAPDNGDGTPAHQMVAYWADNAFEYHYYFLFQVLDTTILATDSNVQAFDPETADLSPYADGQYVSWADTVYVYSTAYDIQYSTSTRSGQNQPSRPGFLSTGAAYDGEDTAKGGNIYFFYTRELYTLAIQNLHDKYSIPEALLTTDFDCLSSYGEGVHTLQQLGWESVTATGFVDIRFGGHLTPLAEQEIIAWLTSETGGDLEYPYHSPGESQYYFWRWYRNATQTMPVDWTNDKEMQTMAGDSALYVGWFPPRYATSYVLNGGIWMEEIEYTLSTYSDPTDGTIFMFYPHQRVSENSQASFYWYLQTKVHDRLFIQNLYSCDLDAVAEWDDASQHYISNGKIGSLAELLAISVEDFTGTRLVDHYYCYMGDNGAYSHNEYVTINATVNTVLEEPAEPVRPGYTFARWFYFDDVPASGTKIYLKDVLAENQSLASYAAGYVYLNHVEDAFLLHEDENGELFYYPEQTGYRFSYTNDASVVVQGLKLYAAWEPDGDSKALVYHLVKKAELEGQTQFTPKDGKPIVVNDHTATITIGGTEYFILFQDELASLYTGKTYTQTAWEYCADSAGRKWLPAHATIDLKADARTQTVTDGDLTEVTGNTYRTEMPDGSYLYCAFFVYHPVNELVYNVYAIDLSVAVAEGVLDSYQDTFDRSFQVDIAAPYLLSEEQKSIKVDDLPTTLVVESAPSISGYSVYEDWSQVLRLQTNASANNIFFYYVRDNAQTNYSITYYLMTNGGYSPENAITISQVPAVFSEIVSLTDMTSTYDHLAMMAQTCRTYSGSTNPAQAALYERYKGMTITRIQNGTTTSFTVDAAGADTLDLATISQFYLDYYVDGWSPTGSSLVISDSVKVEVYLATAQLIVQKVDTSRHPLAGAQFQLERLLEDDQGTIIYNGKSYALDTKFGAVTAISQEDGKALFYNLSARIFEDGKGYLYRLTELQAPQGYNSLEEPLYVTTPYTVEAETHYSVTYTVVNTGIAYLPAAGVFGGVYTTIFAGIGLMATAVGCGIVFWRRKRLFSQPVGPRAPQ